MITEKRPQILLVEDDPDHVELIAHCLAENRIASELHHAANGQQALDYLEGVAANGDCTAFPRPHLILIDFYLPSIRGLDVVKQIKSVPELKSIPVVVLTTSENEADIRDAYDVQVNSYLVKPHDFENFRAMIRDLEFYWCVWNRVPGN